MTKVSGIRLDTRVLDKIAKELNVNTDQAVRSIAFQVEGEAKARAPVDTGALKNSLHTSKKGEAEYWVADGVEYGVYQELGTSRMAAQPFMVPAVENVRRYLDKKFEGLFK